MKNKLLSILGTSLLCLFIYPGKKEKWTQFKGLDRALQETPLIKACKKYNRNTTIDIKTLLPFWAWGDLIKFKRKHWIYAIKKHKEIMGNSKLLENIFGKNQLPEKYLSTLRIAFATQCNKKFIDILIKSFIEKNHNYCYFQLFSKNQELFVTAGCINDIIQKSMNKTITKTKFEIFLQKHFTQLFQTPKILAMLPFDLAKRIFQEMRNPALTYQLESEQSLLEKTIPDNIIDYSLESQIYCTYILYLQNNDLVNTYSKKIYQNYEKKFKKYCIETPTKKDDFEILQQIFNKHKNLLEKMD